MKQATSSFRDSTANISGVFEIANQLAATLQFKRARIILTKLKVKKDLDDVQAVKLDQKLAVYTYKDKELPEVSRLDEALKILTDGKADLYHSRDAETLAIAGSIFKRKWMLSGKQTELEESLSYYLKGYNLHQVDNFGYAAINAAYLYDLLSHQSFCKGGHRVNSHPNNLKFYRKEAARLRCYVIDHLSKLLELTEYSWLNDEWWFLTTLTEAHFGVGNYQESKKWLNAAMRLKNKKYIPSWMVESTARQLANIAQMDSNREKSHFVNAQIAEVLMEVAEESPAALRSCLIGKTGLALSGGGFRAAFYHIGVLAKLADKDVLRHIEVISCVSGGSIIGTYYYLELKHLLETIEDNNITKHHFVEIVDRMSTNFLTGVQKNIRMLTAADWQANFKMLFRQYSRTEKIGELYESELFSRISDGRGDEPRWIDDLVIHPISSTGCKNKFFNIHNDNWHRKVKVPMIILNATTLNTGHNWQFTAHYMGENQAYNEQADVVDHLQKINYAVKPKSGRQKKIRLGHAVAASSCVPGLFEPLSLDEIYPDINVRLVDGGVHDNQGVASLLEQNCELLLISDASGQICADNKPSGTSLGVSLRANDILMERLRLGQYRHVENLYTGGVIKNPLFLHLKLNIKTNEISNSNKKSPGNNDEEKITFYRIAKNAQLRLSAIRTDLDAFHNIEAFGLMCSGYQMTDAVMEQSKPFGELSHHAVKTDWKFLAILPFLQDTDESSLVMKALEIGQHRFFKLWKSYRYLMFATVTFLALTGLFLANLIIKFKHTSIITLGQFGVMIGFFVIFFGVYKFNTRKISYYEFLSKIITSLSMLTVGWVIANLHLLIINNLYLRSGKLPENHTDH